MSEKIKGYRTLNFCEIIVLGLDSRGTIVYHLDMNTKPPVLTKDSIKMLAVQASTHAKVRELAALRRVPLYAAVDYAVQAALSAMRTEQTESSNHDTPT